MRSIADDLLVSVAVRAVGPGALNAPGPPRNYGFVVDNVNVSVFEYEPVRSASVAFTR